MVWELQLNRAGKCLPSSLHQLCQFWARPGLWSNLEDRPGLHKRWSFDYSPHQVHRLPNAQGEEAAIKLEPAPRLENYGQMHPSPPPSPLAHPTKQFVLANIFSRLVGRPLTFVPTNPSKFRFSAIEISVPASPRMVECRVIYNSRCLKIPLPLSVPCCVPRP